MNKTKAIFLFVQINNIYHQRKGEKMMIINIGNDRKVIKNAKKYMTKLGVSFDSSHRHHLTISINDSCESIDIITPVNFAMSEKTLVKVANRIDSIGWCGRQIAKALVGAINGLCEDDISSLRTLCFIKQYKACDVISYFVDWFFALMEANKISINKNHLGIKSCRNLWFLLGGYRGLKATFTTGLQEVIDELRRIRNLEERFDISDIITIDNPDLMCGEIATELSKLNLTPVNQVVENHLCLTCRHCKTDKYGDRICREGYINIPEELTVEEVNKLYPSASTLNYGKLQSKYIFFTMDECDYYHSRIGCRTKKPENGSAVQFQEHALQK